MNKEHILRILEKVKYKNISPEEALDIIKNFVFAETDLGYAKPDFHRGLRNGVSEVIYGHGKTPEQILGISRAMLDKGETDILITRLGLETAAELSENFGESFEYYEVARIGVIRRNKNKILIGNVVIVSGGTSDINVCEEAAVTSEIFGSKVTRIYDVGVAGLHRLFNRLEELTSAKVIIAVAGMEGALASVVGGLVDVPVIAVPTSVGYGANFHGLSALLSMLNSCASGVGVVNIDNGFGAAYLANMINKTS